jgi:hypothetical protein
MRPPLALASLLLAGCSSLAAPQQRCGRRVAAWLLAFLERGEEQGAFDEGEDDPRP